MAVATAQKVSEMEFTKLFVSARERQAIGNSKTYSVSANRITHWHVSNGHYVDRHFQCELREEIHPHCDWLTRDSRHRRDLDALVGTHNQSFGLFCTAVGKVVGE